MLEEIKIGDKVKIIWLNPRYIKDHNYLGNIDVGMVGYVKEIDKYGVRKYLIQFNHTYSYFEKEEFETLDKYSKIIEDENKKIKEINYHLDGFHQINLTDYKSAWEELKEKYENIFSQAKSVDEFTILGMCGIPEALSNIEELEQKYNIGGE